MAHSALLSNCLWPNVTAEPCHPKTQPDAPYTKTQSDASASSKFIVPGEQEIHLPFDDQEEYDPLGLGMQMG